MGGGKRKKGREKKNFNRHLMATIMTARVDQEEALPRCFI
jgi:hypothetical protein